MFKPKINIIIISDSNKNQENKYFEIFYKSKLSEIVTDSILIMNELPLRKYDGKFDTFVNLFVDGVCEHNIRSKEIYRYTSPILAFADITKAMNIAIDIQNNSGKDICIICNISLIPYLIKNWNISNIYIKIIKLTPSESINSSDIINMLIPNVSDFKVWKNIIVREYYDKNLIMTQEVVYSLPNKKEA